MIKRRKIVAVVGLFLFVLAGVRLVWINMQTNSERTEAERGVLDLSRWDPASKPLLSLSGQWEFYPSRLIAPEPDAEGLIPQEEGAAELVKVPGSWKKAFDPAGSSNLGYGTYRLRIVLPSGDLPELTVRVPGISASSALYLNGRLMGSAGHPAADASSYTAGIAPYSVTFTADRAELDLVLQVANYDDRIHGGLTEQIKLGSARAMNRVYWLSVGSQTALMLLLIMHSLYAFALYIIGARQRPLLIFSLIGLFGVLSVLSGTDRLLIVWYGVGFEAFCKFFYLSYLGEAALLLQYVKSLLPEFPILRYSRWYLAACAVFGLFVLASPVSMVTSPLADGIHTLLLLASFGTAPIFIYLAVRKGAPDAIYLLLGAVAVTSNLCWGISSYTLFLSGIYYPIDMLAFFICFALYWFKRYFRNSAEAVRLAERLQAADMRKDEFLVHTSHELRNPLHGMLNMAQAVLDSGERTDEAVNRERLSLLVAAGKRMSFLLNDLMDLNRLRENRLLLNPKPLRLQTEAAGVLDMVRFMAEGKPILLENRVPASLPAVLADENRLVQILFNLLHNAVKFTNEGRISIEAEAAGGKVVVRVADTGIGMDEETASRIFQPYEQGDDQDETNAAGFGLGLAISQRLVELHGGRLTVSSTRGVGSVFSFALPSADAAGADAETWDGAETGLLEADALLAAADATADPLPPARERRSRILAVDDDPVNLRVLKHVLDPGLYEIVTTTSGIEALSLLNSGPWDLLIADVMMPDISGYEVARNVRVIFSRSELPILLLTARYRAEDIAAGFQAEANDYIVKPVEAQELRMRVQALTDVARAAREQKRLEAAWLQAQIQPHFLFNTLNSIAALADTDTERMRELLSVFGEYLRASFDSANSDQLVPLHKELELVRAYLYIEKERFGERIQIVWEGDDTLQVQVPPLSIQPLVENAVRHGALRRAEGGTVRIRIRSLEDGVEIAIEDDGFGMPPELLLSQESYPAEPAGRRAGIGLANTDRRLNQIYGSGLLVRIRPGGGTIVSFVVPGPSFKAPAGR